MRDLTEFDTAAYEWLIKIPPHQWARSHFTGRALSDVLLSNMCEVFNRWLVDARDKPIVTALEYIREYCMKRIVNVIKKKDKWDGPLTIAATKLFQKIKSDANKCSILWGGNQKYQVSGQSVNGQPQEQCVVDMETRSCACRKWELTGMPCKHAVAVNWNMVENGMEVGDPESWYHDVYKLTTWNNTYQFTVEPLNGRHLWPSAGNLKTRDVTLVAPKKVSTPGRPKKKRRLSVNENDDIGEGGKISTQGKLKKCGKCGQFGHNRRGCDGSGSGKKVKAAGDGNGKKVKTAGDGNGKKVKAAGKGNGKKK
ncbi:uncharacterized protein [Rutidosis leptorrhynchoides]|uniref:uncharacterized protein n=1 Tax=Rutidosis leptorrhynchoides TaxID=125765 RepID=UPI003A99830A